MAFPKSLDVCVNGSWHQAHGWGASLAGTCSKPRTNRAIIVVANGSFLTKPEEATGCAKPEVSAGAKLGLSFDGRISATCRENLPEPEGTILITVVTQVDVEDAADHSQPGDAAIDYEAELTTTPAKLKDDLVTFRRVLRSVQIDRPPPTLVR
ncbi:MAG TPA: hypothetical protein VIJ94_09365 [Caulobacteraceae bacterium]